MPYEVKEEQFGYRVYSPTHVFSKKPLTLEKAKAQQRALYHNYNYNHHNYNYNYDAAGIGSFFSNAFKRIKNVFTNEYSPSLENAVKKYGSYKIIRIRINRDPVEAALKTVLKAVSLGKFSYKGTYDDLYHLSATFELEPKSHGSKVFLKTEKRPTIKVDTVKGFDKGKSGGAFVDTEPVSDITFGEMIERIMKAEGEKLYLYDARYHNCQHYILGLVKALGISGLDDFIYQPIAEAVKGLPHDFAHKVTGIGAFFQRVGDVFTGGEFTGGEFTGGDAFTGELHPVQEFTPEEIYSIASYLQGN